jgi:hypothetical protein
VLEASHEALEQLLRQLKDVPLGHVEDDDITLQFT